MKIKQLAMVLFSLLLSCPLFSQTTLDYFGNPSTVNFPVSNQVTSSSASANSATIVNVFPSPTENPNDVAFDGEYLWVTGYDEFILYQISMTDGTVIRMIPIDVERPHGLTFDGENLWIVDTDAFLIHQLDTLDGAVLSTIPTPTDTSQSYPGGLEWVEGNMWHNDLRSPFNIGEIDSLFEINTSGDILQAITHFLDTPTGLAYDGTYLWNSDNFTDKVYKIDLNTLLPVDSIDAPGGQYPNGLAFDGQYLWLCNNDSDSIYQIEIEIDFNFNYQTQSLTCYNDASGSISVSFVPSDSMLLFSWSTGSTASSISDLNAGSYELTITNTSGDVIVDTTFVLTEPSALELAGNTSPEFPGNMDGTATVTVTGGTLPYTYAWDTAPIQTTQTVTDLSSGVYLVTVTDGNGCSSVLALQVGWIGGTLEELALTTFEIYPNPASETAYVHILFEDRKEWILSLYQMDGRLLKEVNAPVGGSTGDTLSLEELMPGMYMVTVEVGDKSISRRLVVQ